MTRRVWQRLAGSDGELLLLPVGDDLLSDYKHRRTTVTKPDGSKTLQLHLQAAGLSTTWTTWTFPAPGSGFMELSPVSLSVCFVYEEVKRFYDLTIHI